MLNFLKSILESLLIFLLFTIFIYSQQEPEYEIIRFGNGFFTPRSMNDSSEVVGIEYYGNEESRFFLWKNGSITYIPVYPFCINNNSAIVGRVIPGSALSIYYSDGSIENIPLPSGFNACWPEGFNDSNVVAGYLRTLSTDSARAFIFDNTITVLPALSGFDTGEDRYNLLAINNSGDAVGNFYLYSLNQTKSYLWSNSNYTILANNSNALDINNLGEIAGKIGNQAVKWVNNIPQYFPGFSIAWAIN